MSDSSGRHSWVLAAVVVGVFYCAVGIVFAAPTSHVRAWRLAAWAVSAVAYAGHLAYERVRLGSPPAEAAWHVALAVALGAFGLAVAANFHSLSIPSTERHRRLLLLALLIWPVMAAVPAFVVAFVAGRVQARLSPRD